MNGLEKKKLYRVISELYTLGDGKDAIGSFDTGLLRHRSLDKDCVVLVTKKDRISDGKGNESHILQIDKSGKKNP